MSSILVSFNTFGVATGEIPVKVSKRVTTPPSGTNSNEPRLLSFNMNGVFYKIYIALSLSLFSRTRCPE